MLGAQVQLRACHERLSRCTCTTSAPPARTINIWADASIGHSATPWPTTSPPEAAAAKLASPPARFPVLAEIERIWEQPDQAPTKPLAQGPDSPAMHIQPPPQVASAALSSEARLATACSPAHKGANTSGNPSLPEDLELDVPVPVSAGESLLVTLQYSPGWRGAVEIQSTMLTVDCALLGSGDSNKG